MGEKRGLAKFAWRFLAEDDSGQATLEYILLISVVASAAFAIGRGIVDALDRGLVVFGGQLEKDLKSGRAPLSVWQN